MGLASTADEILPAVNKAITAARNWMDGARPKVDKVVSAIEGFDQGFIGSVLNKFPGVGSIAQAVVGIVEIGGEIFDGADALLDSLGAPSTLTAAQKAGPLSAMLVKLKAPPVVEKPAAPKAA
ncbi:MAG TPA: hypothetical protein VMB05_18435 [Solirubrobacteraceae bacterium]|nr:hypothetical protein [Solirubrobacteraceae bacterium]